MKMPAPGLAASLLVAGLVLAGCASPQDRASQSTEGSAAAKSSKPVVRQIAPEPNEAFDAAVEACLDHLETGSHNPSEILAAGFESRPAGTRTGYRTLKGGPSTRIVLITEEQGEDGASCSFTTDLRPRRLVDVLRENGFAFERSGKAFRATRGEMALKLSTSHMVRGVSRERFGQTFLTVKHAK